MALFGGPSSGRSGPRPLVEFRAGKMTMKGNMIHSDKRKGTVTLEQGEDGLLHFTWKERHSSVAEDDLIMFADDVEYKKVPQCTTGRVFLLKFKSSGRKLFFWMQEPKAEKDDELLQKMNEYITNPPAIGAGRSGMSTPGEGDLQSLLGGMSQQQFMQLLGGMGSLPNLSNLLATRAPALSGNRGSSSSSGSTAATAGSAAPSTNTDAAASQTSVAASPRPIQLSDLQNILSGLPAPSGSAKKEEAEIKPGIDLASAMTTEALQPLLSNPEFIKLVKEHLPNTKEGANTSDNLKSTLASPQFQQALNVFSSALQSGQLGPLMRQFGMPDDVVEAATAGDMDKFVSHLTKWQNEGSGKKGNDEEEDMALD